VRVVLGLLLVLLERVVSSLWTPESAELGSPLEQVEPVEVFYSPPELVEPVLVQQVPLVLVEPSRSQRVMLVQQQVVPEPLVGMLF
jgi:hypothetical protein